MEVAVPLSRKAKALASGCLDGDDQEELLTQYLGLNPGSLRRRIETTLRRLWSLASYGVQNQKCAGQHFS